MWIKGSGGDIGSLKRDGIAGLYVDKLRSLKKIYRGIDHEDEMVQLFNHCIYDLNSKAPSIDTPLHAMLPFKHIDHLHPDAAIAIAASQDGEKIVKELYGNDFAWIPWQRPGFDLSLKLEEAILKNPNLKGLYLGGHGLFTWGETSYECYINSLETIEKASLFLESNYGKKKPVFGGVSVEPLEENRRKSQASKIMPLLRGLLSEEEIKVGHFTDNSTVLEFINSQDLERLAPMGTSCPDHFLRTKISPLVLNLDPNQDLSDITLLNNKLKSSIEGYKALYTEYYNSHKRSNSPGMRDPYPVIVIWPGIGMFSFAKNKQTARVASEFYINAINVMKGAEAVSEYVSLPLQEAFDIEYWLLEEAKLQRMPREATLSRKVAIVTGSAGGIGKAIAEKFVSEGACVVLTDIDKTRLEETVMGLPKELTRSYCLDITKTESIERLFDFCSLEFGGVDILVNSAGLAISKPLDQTSNEDYALLMDVLVKGQLNLCKKAAEVMKTQSIGGDIVNIASKNGLVSGPNNAVYGTAKAAQQHMSRLLAAELGQHKIRVNIVNPDAVIEGSNIWEGAWAEGRAKAYGIEVKDLPAFYAKRTLLNEIIGTKDLANAVFCFVNGNLSKSTGNMLNVDGGIPAAFVR
jgi:rhamnulose-1-phosphate aldolase/alcohol dehydrogenase